MMARAATITIANGYNTDIGANVQRVKHKLDPDDTPASVIWPEPEEEIEREILVLRKYPDDSKT